MREIVFDTETTGLDPSKGHRIVEIGCVEIENRFPTGRVWHSYFNPERNMPVDAFAIHGLSDEFLKDKPRFADRIDEFLDFVGVANLVAHNGYFDLEFLNHELALAKRSPFPRKRVIDTLALAKRKHRNQKNSLDELCKRYRIDTSKRTRHGALLDAELLAEVYIELTGGRQTTLFVESKEPAKRSAKSSVIQREKPIKPRLTPEEIAAHIEFVSTLKEPIWGLYIDLKDKAA